VIFDAYEAKTANFNPRTLSRARTFMSRGELRR